MKWISMKDQKPNMKDLIVAYDGIHLFAGYTYRKKYNYYWIGNDPGLVHCMRPTHWIPLPLPPEYEE